VAVQIRCLSACNGFACNAIVGVGLVLANGAGRALHAPLPDDEDERAGALSYYSSSTGR